MIFLTASLISLKCSEWSNSTTVDITKLADGGVRVGGGGGSTRTTVPSDSTLKLNINNTLMDEFYKLNNTVKSIIYINNFKNTN